MKAARRLGGEKGARVQAEGTESGVDYQFRFDFARV
jgi:hypothetical protein